VVPQANPERSEGSFVMFISSCLCSFHSLGR
jgi:hypothetical protein